ncbi:unnamed protein product (macronuclear) [Paramecium tetraurelia]|uniref:Late endosomal/lysosomal adaptor and MAPK and MTOR activator 5 n=1 Tax=Paramecium tetraurelia TaxID=5888 RepID=A0BKE5_PARTE|nr:uncharacterized protein GSPATT00029643001 [Paramecium tetraurelia]CAK59012.1 unnamed protein product [Paramecium tetraurelia]|eukprot:XP_001426410.1 hypothetical protein (macronuclear) [Paramecium tetraurelia strain d4-2]
MENKIILNSQSTDLTTWCQQDSSEFDDSCCSNDDNDKSSQMIANFVVGILKPGQKRIGLVAANKNKITISGILGINRPHY